jgi:hypothetical protein
MTTPAGVASSFFGERQKVFYPARCPDPCRLERQVKEFGS